MKQIKINWFGWNYANKKAPHLKRIQKKIVLDLSNSSTIKF